MEEKIRVRHALRKGEPKNRKNDNEAHVTWITSGCGIKPTTRKKQKTMRKFLFEREVKGVFESRKGERGYPVQKKDGMWGRKKAISLVARKA